MKIPVIEGCPFTSEYGIRVRRDCDLLPENASEDNPNLCDVVKIQYAIELERRAVSAEKRVKELESQAESLKAERNAADVRARLEWGERVEKWKVYAGRLEEIGERVRRANGCWCDSQCHCDPCLDRFAEWLKAKETKP